MVAISSEIKTPFLAPQMMFDALLFKGGILKTNSKMLTKHSQWLCNFIFVLANGISWLSSNWAIIYMFNYKIFIFSVCFQLTWCMYCLLILLTFLLMKCCLVFLFLPFGSRYYLLWERNTMNLCWENLWRDGQTIKLWFGGFLGSFIIWIDTLLLGGHFRPLMKLGWLASAIW